MGISREASKDPELPRSWEGRRTPRHPLRQHHSPAHADGHTPYLSHTYTQLYVYKSPRKKKEKKDREKPLLSSIPSIVNVIVSRECLENSFVINIYTLCFWAVICKV